MESMDDNSHMLSSINRRLQSTPAYADFIIIAGLGGMAFMLLKLLLHMSASWKRCKRIEVLFYFIFTMYVCKY